jgi:hypothetical protein
VETGPRLRYIITGQKGTPEWARSCPLCTVNHPKMPHGGREGKAPRNQLNENITGN